ncbi:MAG: hypothetical protein ACLP5H_34470 [Desulfomonilaceae bacterium]
MTMKRAGKLGIPGFPVFCRRGIQGVRSAPGKNETYRPDQQSPEGKEWGMVYPEFRETWLVDTELLWCRRIRWTQSQDKGTQGEKKRRKGS